MSIGTNKQHYKGVTDERLVQYIQQRKAESRSALNELMRRHHVDLLWRCHRYLRNWDDAQDAVQETELRMFRAIDSFKGEAAYRTWLYTIADNQCHTLATRCMRNIMSDHLRALLEDTELTRETSLQKQSEQADLTTEIEQLLKTLPIQAVEILRLRFYSDCSIQEISRILGIGLSATKMRLYRSLMLAENLVSEPRHVLLS